MQAMSSFQYKAVVANPLPSGSHMLPDVENASASNSRAAAPESMATAESPVQAIRRMAGGFAMTQVLHAAARAGIADALGDNARSAAELASALKLHPQALERFLRMMVVLDLLVQESSTGFRLSATGQLLRADHPASMRDRILYIGAINYPVAGAALHAVRTGEPAFDHVFGKPFFNHLAERPELGGFFNDLMKRGVDDRVAGIVQARDFSRAGHIVDIGGGNGALLSAILAQAPQSRGVIFDTAAVIAQARERLEGTAVRQRIDLIEGDLFRGGYPQGADLYLLSNIIHDWSDAQAETILRHCVSAMPSGGKLVLIEELMPERVADSPATIANDYSMLLLTGGQERTEAQYRALLGRSGLTLRTVTPFAIETCEDRRKGNWALLECNAR
jgi:ubiquinone/menaquinone biosynthesis C-methylase UbiE